MIDSISRFIYFRIEPAISKTRVYKSLSLDLLFIRRNKFLEFTRNIFSFFPSSRLSYSQFKSYYSIIRPFLSTRYAGSTLTATIRLFSSAIIRGPFRSTRDDSSVSFVISRRANNNEIVGKNISAVKITPWERKMQGGRTREEYEE